MKKVAVLTINDDNNYGNRLQSYAVQELLKKYKLKVENIRNIEISIKHNIKKMIKIFFNIDNQRKIQKRFKKFKEFNKNINFSKYKINKRKVSKRINNEYDIFFTGSDQVWNPNFGRMSDIDFLTFASKEKRNSISASFGIDKIPNNMREYYRKNLTDMNNISVREDKGKEIVEELTGRKDVEVLLDPTMLLTAEEWNKVSKKPKQLKFNKYILNYFLGELSEERKNEINKIAKENQCEIINILDSNSPFYETGPSEFLYLEKNAFLVCTDSFHSCVFAILFNRPFIVFDREDKNISMNSRIETLLNKFQLQDRKFNGEISEKSLNWNYNEAYKILENEKIKVNKFFKKILEEK